MISLTEHIAAQVTADHVAEALQAGRQAAGTRLGAAHTRLIAARQRLDSVRSAYGLESASRRLLSRPGFQHKLDMAEVPSFGLTLNHHSMRSRIEPHTTFNACPSAGHCVRLCVLNNNFAAAGLVQAGWRWRTEFLAYFPSDFFVTLGWELQREVDTHGHILFRPNVNSDLEWETFAQPLVDGDLFGDAIKLYGYTKHDDVLDSDGWVGRQYRVAYSWNENSDPDRVRQFLRWGGSVGIVTDRWYGPRQREQIHQWDAPLHLDAPVVDADSGDEWMFTEGVIGDLAFKPKTAELRDWGLTTGFVVGAYHDGLRPPSRRGVAQLSAIGVAS